ncbi:IclR family transcriptional regulator [Paraburkholderia caribensis]|uniref:IclR family transcriptional regulator n=1 Tax=Paraburkholderia TaxID=1822464 RepID=UPI001CB42ECF|nr:IclR family transcriptional regulator [Paraburkholderia caribensis]BEU25653.1 IclR family transcriptional regulator [Paraburkholderia sp. 22B1P]CAG9262388.1 IclR family transcriptional regulator [Paraburkholderia caribensis]
MPTHPIDSRLSPSNRSVERALLILRAFRPGVGRLGNMELAERTGLARSTVSRLTQTLVESGFLDYDVASGSYRLGAPVLSLAHALRLDSDVLNFALPVMRETAEDHRINVGLAVADQADMVYLESVRRNRRELFRHVASGSRVPVELTSLGRAYLSTLSAGRRSVLEPVLRERHPDDWRNVSAGIEQSLAEIRSDGFCSVSWQAGITSIAAPLSLGHLPPYVFNISYASDDFGRREVRSSLAPLLLGLVQRVRGAFAVDAI